ncbi:MAG TPA: hypothetical protein VFX44_07195 [Solirubrobacterales bacterium]|nr:hypothetical protein [Solirubrobacterales bacterium]
MRKTALLLLLLLVALLTAAGPAQALIVSVPSPALSVKAEEPEEEENEEGEAGPEEGEECEADPEEGEDCEEAEAAEEEAAAEECVIEDATAKVAANPGNDTVRLTIHYRTFAPAAVAINSKLHGSKGSLHLGASHTRFRRAGVFHDSFGLSKREMAKAMAAREFAIDLHAVNTPGYCRTQLTVHRGGTRKLLWS